MSLDFNFALSAIFEHSQKAEKVFVGLREADELYLFGGAVRDFIEIKSTDIGQYSPRDFDFVVRTSQKGFIEKVLRGCEYRRNNFGGFKAFVDGFVFDIWEMKNTWAFKKKLVKERSENLYKTVFLDIDAIVYDVHKNKIIKNQYNKVKKRNEIDVILKKNPCIELNLLRALYFKRHYKIEFSKRLNEIFVNEMLNNEDFYYKVYSAQLNHYKPCKLTIEEIKDELEKVKQIIAAR